MKTDEFADGEYVMSPSDDGGIRERHDPLSYAGYTALGGIINEADYNAALSRARNTKPGAMAGNGELLATHYLELCGIHPDAVVGEVDVRVLYAILRNDTKPSATPHHHSQMDDQVLLREVLRMLEDTAAIAALEAKFSNIFNQAG